MNDYRAKENYVHHGWTVERRRGHLYAVLLEEHEEDLRDKYVLHLGCNSGSTTQMLWDYGPAYVRGIDINPDAVAAAHDLGRGYVRVGNAVDLPAKWYRRPFETIVAFDIIEHIYADDMPRFVEGCHRSLVRRGRVLAFSPREVEPSGPEHVQCFQTAESFAAPWLEKFRLISCEHETRANPNDGARHDAWMMVLEAL